MLKINIPLFTAKENVGGLTIKRPNWKKAYSEDIEEYSYKLNEKLLQLPLPSSFGCLDVSCQNVVHSLERDSHVLDVLCNTIETSFECIPVSESHSKIMKKRPNLHGWKVNVLPYKNDSLFWHSIWLSMGKPKSGGVFDVMKHTRNKFH